MDDDVPGWCRWRCGDGAMLVLAPHGGLSSADLLDRPLRGNDLHTVGVAGELAERLDASLIVNDGADRNDVDLNRVGDVVERAPWYLRLIEDLLERILANHGDATLLFVHGWHVVQARCDIGVGVTLEAAESALAHADRLTVSPGYVQARLESLRSSCARLGILATYGERWPAAHRNNVMQLFRRSGGTTLRRPDRIARWASEGRLNAVQLELGAPLRWPGAVRSGFVAAAAAAFGERGPDSSAASPSPASLSASLVASPSGTPALSVRAFDPDASPSGIGVIAGVARLPGGDLGARFLLLPGDRRMGLFTGHGRDQGSLAVPGLALHEDGRGVTLDFAGPLLLVEDAARYFREERAQAEARLVEGKARLVCRPLACGGAGMVEGAIELDGERWRLSTGGFVESGATRAATTDHVIACFGPELALRAEMAWESGEARIQRLTPEGAEDLGTASIEAKRGAPGGADGFRLALAGAPHLLCEPETRLTVLRPAPRGGYRCVTVATARFRWGESARGGGFYERSSRNR